MRLALRRCGVAAVAVLVAAAFAGAAVAATFSGDMVQTMGQNKMTSKVYVQGNKLRQEMAMGQQKLITIVRMDKQVAWMINPAQKTYMEMRGAPKEAEQMTDAKKLKEAMQAAGDLKRVGTEKINGYMCDKYTLTPRDKSQGTQTAWIAQKLGAPIKFEQKTAKSTMLIELKNIKEGKLAGSLFEIPKGYKKAEAPSKMPAGAGGKATR